MAKVIIHPLFEQKLHEYVEEAYEVYGRKYEKEPIQLLETRRITYKKQKNPQLSIKG